MQGPTDRTGKHAHRVSKTCAWVAAVLLLLLCACLSGASHTPHHPWSCLHARMQLHKLRVCSRYHNTHAVRPDGLAVSDCTTIRKQHPDYR